MQFGFQYIQFAIFSVVLFSGFIEFLIIVFLLYFQELKMEPTKIVQENITSIRLAGSSRVIGTDIENKPEPKVSQTSIEGVANIYEVYQHTDKPQ